MNDASRWRREIAEHVGNLYAENAKSAAVMISGSTARGHADRFSDIEIGVFWYAPPTDEDRARVVAAAGADLIYHYPYNEKEQVWSDDFMIGRNAAGDRRSGVMVEVAHHTADFMQATLDRVLIDHSTDLLAHNLVAGVLHGLPTYGNELIDHWQTRARAYPHDLAVAIVRRYGVIDHFWRWQMFLNRGLNLTLLYESFAQAQQRALHMLLAVNRVYYFGFKWLPAVVKSLRVKPKNLLKRLQRAYTAPPNEGAEHVISVVEDTFTMVEAGLPSVDVDRLRAIFRYERPEWSERPPIMPGG